MVDVPTFVSARVGTVIRKYRVDRVLGMGGMAAVYAATHRNGNKVALKLLHPAMSVDGDLRARFLREGYVANRVDHPGVVRVLDDDEGEDGAVFLVMELLVGVSAEDHLRARGALPAHDALPIAFQVLDVLAAAHAKGIVHRDIKPDNVFLTRDGVKVLDFGIARLAESGGGERTRTGRCMGTPAFMAPEQALGRTREIGPWTDVWAAGATLFKLLANRVVHDGETPEELLIASATRPAPALATVRPGVPAAVAAVVDRALSADRHGRWPSAAAMRDAVAAAYAAIAGDAADPAGWVLTPPLPFSPAPVVATGRAGKALVREPAPPLAPGDTVPLAPPPAPAVAAAPVSTADGVARSAGRLSALPRSVRGRHLAAAGAVLVAAALVMLFGARARSVAASPPGSARAAVAPVDASPADAPAPPTAALPARESARDALAREAPSARAADAGTPRVAVETGSPATAIALAPAHLQAAPASSSAPAPRRAPPPSRAPASRPFDPLDPRNP